MLKFLLVNGETRSKFYSSVGVLARLRRDFDQVRFIEDQVHGVTGDGVGAYVIISGVGYETSLKWSFLSWLVLLKDFPVGSNASI